MGSAATPGVDGRWWAWLGTLYGGWVLAWLGFRALQPHVALMQTPTGEVLWWTLAKLVVWVAPVARLSRALPLSASALGLPSRRVPLALAVAAGWVLVLAAGDFALGRVPAPALSAGVMSACFIAPWVEELVFRGFAWAWLSARGLSFWRVNLTTAGLFALLHVPGWLFMQRPNAGPLLGQFVQTVAFGLGLGLVRRATGSLWGAIIVHFANNAWAQGLLAWLWWSRG